MAKDKKSRGWLTVCYPESAPVDWVERLAQAGVMALISPLHKDDVNADGETKKPHYHVILLWEGPTTYSNAKEFVALIGGVGCIAMATLRGAARYLCHLDNPEKAQYDPADVRSLGGLDYQEIIASASDDLLALYEIFDYIEEHKITSFRQLVYYCRYERTDWARVILTSQRENVWKYLRSMEYDLSQQDTAGI